jgi:hypothetical protein
LNADLPGGPRRDEHLPEDLSPEEFGPVGPGTAEPGMGVLDEPGLRRLLGTLTSAATPGELAGEQAALAMFRAHVHAPASAPAVRPEVAAANGTAVAADALAAAAALTGSDRGAAAAQPAAGETRPMRQLPGRRAGRPRADRRPWARGIPRLRLASVGAAALVVGFASAAYAAVLPAPVQHAAYVAFHWAGVPDGHHARPTSSSGGSSSVTTPTAGHSSGRKGSHPKPSGSVSGSHSPNGKTSGKPGSSPAPSASSSPGSTPPATGPVVLTLSAPDGTAIPAGSSATIDGQLTVGGKADAGVFVRLMERLAGHVVWVRVARAETNAQGDVALTSPDLTRNAWFRLAYATTARSAQVEVMVVPGLTTSLRLGPKGIKDYLTVSATFAQTGDVVLLQVLKNGSWVTLQRHELTATGGTVFAFSATKRQNELVQAVLLATKLHAGTTSAPVTVPPPA